MPLVAQSHRIDEFSESRKEMTWARSHCWLRVIRGCVSINWPERTSAPPVNSLLTLPYPEAPPPDWAENSGVLQRKVEKGGAGKRAVACYTPRATVSILHKGFLVADELQGQA